MWYEGKNAALLRSEFTTFPHALGHQMINMYAAIDSAHARVIWCLVKSMIRVAGLDEHGNSVMGLADARRLLDKWVQEGSFTLP